LTAWARRINTLSILSRFRFIHGFSYSTKRLSKAVGMERNMYKSVRQGIGMYLCEMSHERERNVCEREQTSIQPPPTASTRVESVPRGRRTVLYGLPYESALHVGYGLGVQEDSRERAFCAHDNTLASPSVDEGEGYSVTYVSLDYRLPPATCEYCPPPPFRLSED
jgi:hypothetical protein